MLNITLTGLDTASAEGVTVTCTKSPITKLARALVRGGMCPARDCVATRDGQAALSGTLGALAARVASEGDHSARFVKWAPHPLHSTPEDEALAARLADYAPHKKGAAT